MKRRKTEKVRVSGWLIAGLLLVGAIAVAGGDEETTPSETQSETLSVEQSTESTSSEEQYYFEVHYLDVGQGDAALVLCDGSSMLIDGGGTDCAAQIQAYLQSQEVSYLDYVVATHAHEDHIGGLPGVLDYAEVGEAYCSVDEYDSEAFAAFSECLQQADVPLVVPEDGDTLALGGAQIQFLGPLSEADDQNNNSLVLRIVYGETSFLFTGDAEREEEESVLDAGYELKSDVLKVGHHGGENSTTYPFLYEIEPEYAVISVGTDNTYGHPDDDTLSRLRDADVITYRTDMQGTIICRSDGQELSFTTEYAPDAQTPPTATPEPTPEPTPTPAPTPVPTPQEIMVWIPQNGSKYHSRSSCSGMNNPSQVTLSQAVAWGYEPCKKCH